jgi:hypothetical protein
LEVVLPARTNEDTSAQHAIFGSGTSGNGVRLGFNSANNIGYVTALKPATSWSNLQLEGAAIILAPSATERVRVTTDGLTFNGDTAAANALDDYEEGTFTPSLGGDATYLAQSGSYTKIGRVVNFKAVVYVNLIGTGSTTTISGLPFTNAAGGGAVCSVPHYSGLATSVSSVNGNVSSTSISVNSNVGNATTNQTLNAIFQNSTYMEIAGTYNV